MERYLRITMPDDTKWDVPVRVIADHRARYYMEYDFKQPDNKLSKVEIFDEEFANLMETDDTYDIEDWAANNMNWKDVELYAVKVSDRKPLTKSDFQEGWCNGEKKVIKK